MNGSTERLRAVVIPTHDRFEDFLDCIDAIEKQVDYVAVVDHRSGYATQALLQRRVSCNLNVLTYTPEVPNISTMWNIGLRMARCWAKGQPVDVVVLNDDVVVPPGWSDRVLQAMGDTGASMGSTSCLVRHVHLHDAQSQPNIYTRPSGFAFIISGDVDLEADEQFQWWWGDTDLDFRARQLGGTVVTPSELEHRRPNSTTVGVLAKIAGQDRARFIAKWGAAPW